MAKLRGPLAFTGKLQGLSAYTRAGSDAVILRHCYGPSKKDIESKPAFSNTRRNIKEFGGRSTAAKWIRDGYHHLKPISDTTNLARLNSLLQAIQEMDTHNEYGKRSVALSSRPELLEGFPLNQRHPFESVLHNPVNCNLSREQLRATIVVPAMMPSVNFIPPVALPYFRLVATLAIVPDLYYDETKYRPEGKYEVFRPEMAQTEWMVVKSGAEAISMELQMPVLPPNDQFSLVLTLGIEMGTANSTVLIKGVKYAGCGKILAVV